MVRAIKPVIVHGVLEFTTISTKNIGVATPKLPHIYNCAGRLTIRVFGRLAHDYARLRAESLLNKRNEMDTLRPTLRAVRPTNRRRA